LHCNLDASTSVFVELQKTHLAVRPGRPKSFQEGVKRLRAGFGKAIAVIPVISEHSSTNKQNARHRGAMDPAGISRCDSKDLKSHMVFERARAGAHCTQWHGVCLTMLG